MLPPAVLTKVSLSSIRILSSRCLEVYCRCQQQACYSKVQKNVEFVKQWYAENKKLFGPILKKKKKKGVEKDPVVTGDFPGLQFHDDYNRFEATPAFEKGFPVTDSDESAAMGIGRHNEGSQEIINDLVRSDTGTLNETGTVLHNVKGDSVQPSSPVSEDVQEGRTLGHALQEKVDDELDLEGQHSFDSLLMFPMFKNDKSFSFPLVSQNASGSFVPPEIERLDYYESFPSVSAILDKTRPPEAQFYLDRWKKQMIEKLGEEGFQLWQKETFGRGSNLHECIKSHLEGKPGVEGDLIEGNAGHWASLQTVFPDISEVKLMEQRVCHPDLHYRGVFDCIASYRGEICLIDWKTSKKPKPTLKDTYDNPLQLAAYTGAINYDSRYDIQIHRAMVVIAYEDGSRANAHWLSKEMCVHYWGQWLHRLAKYWTLKLEELRKGSRTTLGGDRETSPG